MNAAAVSLLAELLVAAAVAAVILRHLRHGVAALAAQGAALGVLAAVVNHGPLGLASAALAVVAKAVLVPWLLHRTALRTAAFQHDAIVSSWRYAGILGVLVAVRWMTPGLGAGLTLPALSGLVPAALAAILLGLLIVATRRPLPDQILGLALAENGLYAASIALTGGLPAVLDLALLFDFLLALFVLLWLTDRIKQVWGHIDVDRLDRLRG